MFEFDSLKDYADLINYVTQKRNDPNNKCFLFIDEVQDIASFEKALRHFFAEGSYVYIVLEVMLICFQVNWQPI